jgi:hypothetical protein
VHLHSRYDPQAEAARYINSLDLKDNLECFILIEPGLGYMIPVLQDKFKNCRIIVLHIESGFPENGVPTLNSIESDEVQKFLEKELQNIASSFIRIIEWRPSMNYYREKYVKLLSLAVEFIKRSDAEKRTVAAFGIRWFKNFFKNLRLLNSTLLYKSTDIPVIITGSGPSLEAAIPFIRKIQNNCIVIAASSSVMALNKNGISADIVIATDGGCWALQHIYPMFRNYSGSSLAVNLCAALPSQCGEKPFLVLNDGSFWQSIILHELKLPSVIIPQRGTVTASAVELALVLTSGNIFLAGMDLSVRDIKTHVRPYGFDYLFFGSADRISPVYSKYFSRSRLIREGGSMDVYAAWFKNQLALWPKRIFSLGGNTVFENALPSEQKNKRESEYFKVVKVNEDIDLFCKRGVYALLSALKNPEYAQNIKVELASLLLPQKKEVTESELEAAINGAVDG